MYDFFYLLVKDFEFKVILLYICIDEFYCKNILKYK